MIFEPTKAIAKMFDQKEIRYELQEQDTTSAVFAQFRAKTAPHIAIHFISNSDKNDVAVRVLNYVTIPSEKREQALEVINELHRRYRFLRFVLTENNRVIVEYDIPVSCVALSEIAYEMCVRFLDVADNAYAEFMKVIW